MSRPLLLLFDSYLTFSSVLLLILSLALSFIACRLTSSLSYRLPLVPQLPCLWP